MEKRLPVALRAVARFKSAKKGRRDAEDAEGRGLFILLFEQDK